jgi:hypothetical protein
MHYSKEAALASGMETDVPALLTITKFSRIINSHPQNHAIVKKMNRFEFLSRPYLTTLFTKNICSRFVNIVYSWTNEI